MKIAVPPALTSLMPNPTSHAYIRNPDPPPYRFAQFGAPVTLPKNSMSHPAEKSTPKAMSPASTRVLISGLDAQRRCASTYTPPKPSPMRPAYPVVTFHFPPGHVQSQGPLCAPRPPPRGGCGLTQFSRHSRCASGAIGLSGSNTGTGLFGNANVPCGSTDISGWLPT